MPQDAAFYALASVLLAQTVAIGVAYLKIRKDESLQKSKEIADRILQQRERRATVARKRLSDFYGPLRSLLHRSQYNFTAMANFMMEGREQEASGILTNRLYPLNQEMAKVVAQHSHLLHFQDEESLYDQLTLHVEWRDLKTNFDIDKSSEIAFPSKIHAKVDYFYNIVAREAAEDLFVEES